MIIESPKLVNVIINHWDQSAGQLPMQKDIEEIEGNGQDVAIVSSRGSSIGYSLAEILIYLLEKAERTDNAIDDMKAGIG